MNARKPALAAIAAITAVLALTACEDKNREAEMKNRGTEIVVHEDPAGPSKFLRLPGPVTAARWAEVPVVAGARDDLGPADKRLYVVLSLDSGSWPLWEAVLRRDEPGPYYLDEAVAEKLLPPDWLAATQPDTLKRSRRLDGEVFDPDSLATSWYQGSVAIRHGDHLFLEFISK